MAFNVDEIKARLQYSGARPNLFDVRIMPPQNIAGAQIANDIIRFVVKAASLPASTIGSIEIPYFGRKVVIPGDRTYIDWTVTVVNDENFLVKRALEAWHEAINSPTENRRVNGADSTMASVKGTADVVQYSKDGEALYRYEFVGIYPSEIAQIDTSWENNDTIEEFAVTFRYDYWLNQSKSSRTRSE